MSDLKIMKNRIKMKNKSMKFAKYRDTISVSEGSYIANCSKLEQYLQELPMCNCHSIVLRHLFLVFMGDGIHSFPVVSPSTPGFIFLYYSVKFLSEVAKMLYRNKNLV